MRPWLSLSIVAALGAMAPTGARAEAQRVAPGAAEAAEAAPATEAATLPVGPGDSGEPVAPPPWSGLSSAVPSYLWDGGAAVFVWGALAGRLALDRWATPPGDPLGFSASEGGRSVAPWEVPDWALWGAAGSLGAALAIGDDDARWYHVKGLAEALATGHLLTGVVKVTFGRHRPDYSGDPDAGFGGGDRSFPSGHAVVGFELAAYAGLYLRAHGLDRWRPPGRWRWWEGAAYAGLFAGASLIAAERVLHHRHHVTDVLAGAALGTTSAALFFAYQEHRYRRARVGGEAAAPRALWLAPVLDRASAGVLLQGTY